MFQCDRVCAAQQTVTLDQPDKGSLQAKKDSGKWLVRKTSLVVGGHRITYHVISSLQEMATATSTSDLCFICFTKTTNIVTSLHRLSLMLFMKFSHKSHTNVTLKHCQLDWGLSAMVTGNVIQMIFAEQSRYVGISLLSSLSVSVA
mgnify:CR=1 FL=1